MTINMHSAITWYFHFSSCSKVYNYGVITCYYDMSQNNNWTRWMQELNARLMFVMYQRCHSIWKRKHTRSDKHGKLIQSNDFTYSWKMRYNVRKIQIVMQYTNTDWLLPGLKKNIEKRRIYLDKWTDCFVTFYR